MVFYFVHTLKTAIIESMQRTYLVGLIAALVIFILGGVIVFGGYNKKVEKPAPSKENTVAVDPAQDIVWNAYSMQGGLFIYPATWELVETKTAVKNKMEPTMFTISSADDGENHSITVAFGCGTQIKEGSDCVKGFLFTALDQTPLTLAVYSHMKSFLETGATQ